MAEEKFDTLINLNDSDMTLTDDAEDVRGDKVFDTNNDEVGDVEDLLIDQQEKKVRYLQIGAGGFLGVGEKKFLIPVDSITNIDHNDDKVFIDKDREYVAGGPEYDPDVHLKDENYYPSLYGYYGYAPYWSAGYNYPGYPYYVTRP